MTDDLEKQLRALADELKRRLSLYETKSTGAASSLTSTMRAEDVEFFEELRRLVPQFDTIQSMFNRWQELAGIQ